MKFFVALFLAAAAITANAQTGPCANVRTRTAWGSRTTNPAWLTSENENGQHLFLTHFLWLSIQAQPPNAFVVHHTAGARCTTQAACDTQMRNIQNFHMVSSRECFELSRKLILLLLLEYQRLGWHWLQLLHRRHQRHLWRSRMESRWSSLAWFQRKVHWILLHGRFHERSSTSKRPCHCTSFRDLRKRLGTPYDDLSPSRPSSRCCNVLSRKRFVR